MVKLFDYQADAVMRMRVGCILCGGVGSGKSRTALAYYSVQCGAELNNGMVSMIKPTVPLYIITTARKRDTLDWEKEATPFVYGDDILHVDSWNSIKKYENVKDAFFIFDEQRVIGSGQWVKSFLKITKSNRWILLSATPGDTWTDYIPVFIANGFYKSRTEFNNEHVIWKHIQQCYWKVDRYVNVGRLIRLRSKILVDMDFERKTTSHHEFIYCNYDKDIYRFMMKYRCDPVTNYPYETAGTLCLALRKLVNSDENRQIQLLDILDAHPAAVIFYSYDYELDILRNLAYQPGTIVAEWNGHKHEPIPEGDKWVYLVQYTAGAEGWNCITTDTLIFFSQQYSYKVLAQSCGRIDRLNTPFLDLYYYHLVSKSPIDLAIGKALAGKKNFNEKIFAKW